ncbi:CPBP family intramembrane metalloprotease [Nocardiopsis sp. CT-R113]|uniref:CPBP family intramembrane metalloprotease n=1 Tax=Nocardiopsis codii TaxID=3065942 RepID=A0ABU7KEG5_9ACTN|nr:CPBP family intramembrane glutamic endopeptidase [Nocardiopsis sp. CT-R113]MEE2040629.1 CPBP family intramembrane metalloprotease [Nocardiopsis sp. CT-R113]
MPHDGAPASTPRRSRRTAARSALLLLLFGALAALLPGVTGAVGASVWALPLGVAAAALGLWAYRLAIRRIEGREPLELSREGAARGLGWGTSAGIGVFTVTITAIALLGGYRVTGWGSFEAFLAVCGLMCAVAVAEELLFRGVLFRIVEEVVGTWGALAVSSALFGGLHLVNPNATLWGALAIALEAGLMLGAAYAATRSLWLPIGLHLGWNTAQAGIFGTAVSGSEEAFAGLLTGETSGPAAISGGAFGPEGSVFAVLFCGAVTVCLLRVAHRRGHIVPRAARRA